MGGLRTSIMQAFSNLRAGERILEAALTQVLTAYRRYTTLHEARFRAQGRTARVAPVAWQAVVTEAKRLKSAAF